MNSNLKNIFLKILIVIPLFCKSQNHEYLFNNNLNELNGGPAIVEILACGAGNGSYGVQTAGTTGGDCLTFNSFCFNDGGGLQYSNPGLITSSYTINMFFRFSSLGGYARVIDFSNSTSDAGVYFLGNCLNFYPNGNVGTCPYFNTNTYYLITFVRDGGTNIISVYVDGSLFGSYTDSGNLYRTATANTPINFFRDDNPVPCEAQPGCVKYISVSPNVSSASDVALIWTNIAAITQSTNVPLPSVTAVNSGNLNCSASTAVLTATSPGNTMVWNGGSLSNSPNPATVSAVGTYTVTVTNSNGCTNSTSVIVAVNTLLPTVTASSSGNLTCSAASVTLTGTSIGNTMVWNGGSLNNAANPATVTVAGTYTVTATDAVNGCVNTASVIVTSGGGQTIIASVNSATICSGQTAVLTAGGGTTYSWSTGETTNSITVSPSSTASFTVTGTTSGCSDDTIAVVTVIPKPAIIVNSPTICAGQTAALTAGGGASYSWSTGETTNSITVSPSSTASYTVTGTTSGCSDDTIAVVTFIPLPSIIVNSPTICIGQTATLTAGGGTTYSWSTGEVINPITVSPSSTASYTVTGSTGGCSNTAIASVTIGGSLSITVISSIICKGDTAVLTASGGNTYLWSTGTAGNSISVAPASDTSYTITGTTSGCSGTASASVTVIAIPIITVNSPTICDGQTAALTVSGGTTYLWSTGAAANSISVSPAATTSYTVTGTTAGCSDSAAAIVTITPLPAISVNSATICAGDTAVLTAAGGNAFSWNTGDLTNTISVSPSSTITYTVTGTALGCSNTAFASVTVNPIPVVTVNSPSICAGGTAILTAYGASAYSWSTGSVSNIINDSPAATTTYTVTGSSLGCLGTAISIVTVNPFLSVNAAGTISICLGSSAFITAAAINGSGGPYTYSWVPGLINTDSLVAVSPAITTTYTVTANDGCSPSASDTITVTVLPNPTAEFTADVNQGCSPLCVNFTDLSSASGGIIMLQNWNFGAEGGNVQHCFADQGQYSITLTVISSNGCVSSLTDTNMIFVSAYPTASFITPISIGILDPTVNFTDNSIGASLWNWNFNDSSADNSDNTSSIQNPSHTYSEVGTYCITLAAGNAYGCYDSTQVCLDVENEFAFYIPNSFSPDGDNINDEFYGVGINIQEFNMQIYDRWGNLVFYSDDIEKHWDAKINGSEERVQADVYVYIIKIKDNKKKVHKYLGDITIMKN